MFRTAMAYLPITVLMVLAALTTTGFAQDVPVSTPSVHSLIVNVFDTSGNAIRDLTKENFRVRLNGKPVAVLDASYTTAPRKIVVLLDMSHSMIDHDNEWNIAREAVLDLLAQTPDTVPIAMLTFTHEIRDEFNSYQNRGPILEWLNGPGRKPILKSRARTALFDAIVKGVNLLGGLQPGDVIYAITDGGDNASSTSENLVRAALLRSQVRLFAILLVPSSSIEAQLTLDKRDVFVSLVEDSGGFLIGGTAHPSFGPHETINYLFKEDSRKKVGEWTRWLNIQVNEFWTLDLDAPPSEKNRKIKVDVVSREGTVRKDVGIMYPRLLRSER